MIQVEYQTDDNVMIVDTDAVSSGMAKKHKIEISDAIASPKRRKLDVNDTDDNDISIIENDINKDTIPDNKKLKSKRKLSEDDDCLIVHDDNMQSSTVSQ